jgi:hypothetical protein
MRSIAERMKFGKYWPYLSIILILVATAVQLHLQGRVWWCACGSYALWNGDIWSSHNSQHLCDAYSFTHILHGALFAWIVGALLRKIPKSWQAVVVVLAESIWELVENSQFIIHRYREATISLGYEGDSIINSLGDIFCCACGFFIAKRLGFKRSLIVFFAVELLLLILIRDNLTLNILMLIYPVKAIKSWQMIH